MSFTLADRSESPIPTRYWSVADLVYHQLRDEIYAWTLRPGDKLNIEAIASRLDVSTMPVREALRRLAADGHVVSAPHRGAWVAPCSIEQIRYTAKVRAWLEADGIRAALPKLHGAITDELEELHSAYADAMNNENWPATARINLDYHLAIHRQAGNPVLLETLQDLFARTERVRGLTGQFAELDTKILLDDHGKILHLIRQGDADGCADAMHRHVLRGLGRLADYLEVTYGPDLDVPDGITRT